MRRPAGAALLSLALATACGSTVPLAEQRQSALGGDGLSSPSAVASTAAGALGTTSTVAGGTTSTAPGGVGQASGPTATGTGGVPVVEVPRVAGAAGSIPATGRGWDRKKIYVGYVTQNDFNAVAASSGYDAINAGDQVGDINAVLAAINRAGGLFGRQVVGIDRDNSSAEVSGNPTATSAANCAYFTQDRPVIAVLNLQSGLDTPTFRSCMTAAKLPAMSLSVQPVTARLLADLKGYTIPLLVPTYDRLAPVLVDRLKARGYFTGWSTSTSSASPVTPVKVGLLVTSDKQGEAVAAIMKAHLTRVGFAPTVFAYTASGAGQQTSFQSAVLKFSSSGITHVLADSANLALFMIQASAQGYKPRYGISSYSAPQPFLQGLAPASQLVGSMGVGSAPTIDVARTEDPGPTPGSPYCTKVLAQGGQTFDSYRFANAIAFALCDGLRAVVSAALASGGLTGPSIVAGIAKAGPTFPTSFAFSSGFSARNFALPGSGRDLAYDTGCECFRYSGKSFAF